MPYTKSFPTKLCFWCRWNSICWLKPPVWADWLDLRDESMSYTQISVTLWGKIYSPIEQGNLHLATVSPLKHQIVTTWLDHIAVPYHPKQKHHIPFTWCSRYLLASFISLWSQFFFDPTVLWDRGYYTGSTKCSGQNMTVFDPKPSHFIWLDLTRLWSSFYKQVSFSWLLLWGSSRVLWKFYLHPTSPCSFYNITWFL